MRADDLTSTQLEAWKSVLTDPATASCVCDLQCVVQAASPAFERLLGVEPGKGCGFPLLRAAAPEALEGSLTNLRRACAGEARGFIFHGVRSETAEPFHAIFVAVPLVVSGHVDRIACLAFALPKPAGGASHHPALPEALENLGEGAAIVDSTGCLRWANAAFARITGYDPRAVQGAPLPFLSPGTNLLYRARGALRRDGFWQGEVQGLDARGNRLFLLASLSVIPGPSSDKDSQDTLLLFCDISRQHARKQDNHMRGDRRRYQAG